MELIQVLAILFSIFAFSRVVLRFKHKNISLNEFIFWSFVWFGIILGAITPKIFEGLSKFIGIKRPVDIAIYVSMIVLFYLVFRLYVKMEKAQSEITSIIRDNALMNAKK